MTPWKRTIDVSVPFHSDDLSLEQKAVAIVAIFRRTFPEHDEPDLDFLLDDLLAAGTEDDVSFFDDVWSEIYDWADDTRVWVDTFAKPNALAASR